MKFSIRKCGGNFKNFFRKNTRENRGNFEKYLLQIIIFRRDKKEFRKIKNFYRKKLKILKKF